MMDNGIKAMMSAAAELMADEIANLPWEPEGPLVEIIERPAEGPWKARFEGPDGPFEIDVYHD
jgi:hypothetical protein